MINNSNIETQRAQWLRFTEKYHEINKIMMRKPLFDDKSHLLARKNTCSKQFKDIFDPHTAWGAALKNPLHGFSKPALAPFDRYFACAHQN